MKLALPISALLLATTACATAVQAPPPPVAVAPAIAPAPTVDPATEDRRLIGFVDAAFDTQAARSPQFLTSLGSKEQ